MSTLRKMIDGVGALKTGVLPSNNSQQLTVQSEVVVRRTAGFGRQRTTEVMVGKILAFADGKKFAAVNSDQLATVSIQRAGAVGQRLQIPVRALSPVSAEFRRSSAQFKPQFHGRV